MGQPCDCAKCEELLQGFVDRELTDGERREVEGHLAGCSECTRYYRLEETLRRHVRRCCDEPMPDGLKERLRALSARL